VSKSRLKLLTLLKLELAFLERGGYGGALPWRPVSIFQDSPSCANRPDDKQCAECWMFEFVPEQFQQEDPPCHFIALNAAGETVHSMSRQYSQAEVEQVVRGWLQAEIQRIEALGDQPDRVASGAN
jgi:hypothetical protein